MIINYKTDSDWSDCILPGETHHHQRHHRHEVEDAGGEAETVDQRPNLSRYDENYAQHGLNDPKPISIITN